MTQITKCHAEWAVVDRLRSMLNGPAHAEYNVTQAYGLCVAILAWVMQRVRTREDHANSLEDQAAISVKAKLDEQRVEDDPWDLRTTDSAHRDFKDFSAFAFLKWLRDACCHGDARKVFPENQHGELIGFSIRMKSDSDQKTRSLLLVESDLRRIGCVLADMYCEALQSAASNTPDHFASDARSMREERTAV